ncbi:GPI mannosyltransferase 4 [Sitophilus oryzae]|uniref:Mannosyltransferase n=1 Tax=Sitophilus oryzae TaxID=7048 RepID=A0A6J2XD20_SITOR|nr:GPI mannosyltransferase 4 [Sitophilus oryzae]
MGKMGFYRNSHDIFLYGLRAFRILLIFAPQIGYIHPDEYFQSVEVLAGKIFDVENSPPWEFNTTFPIRGMTIPYFTTGMSYIFLRDINKWSLEYLSLNVVTPYFLLMLPRFLVGLLSFLVDYCLYQICLNNNEKFKTRLIVLNTSFVILVFGSRTFSNSLEIIFFALLLYFVCESQTFSNELLRKKEYLKYRYDKSTTCIEKAKFHKLKLYLVSDTYTNGLLIATITIFGIFNRPTFIGFAVVPVFFWIYRGTGINRVSVLQFHSRIIFFALCCIPALIFNIIIDSFYYGYITWGEIGMLDVSINNFVVTPLNFIRYNAQSKNLAKHGLHPQYLHLLINIPLLFNILGISALHALGQYIYLFFRKQFHLLPSIRSIKMVMIMSFITPVLLLSVFPHQEARFIIPIVLPLVYLHGLNILPEMDKAVVRVPEYSLNEKSQTTTVKRTRYIYFKVWFALNLLLVVFFGFVHQGGIYSAINYLYKDIKYTSLDTEYHIITSHIYSLPESFLLQRNSNKLYYKDNVKYSVKKRVYLYEEGSKDLLLVVNNLEKLAQARDFLAINIKHSKKYKLYLLISSSRNIDLERILERKYIKFKKVDNFWPHISTEAFPDYTHYCFDIISIFFDNCESLSFLDYIRKILDLSQLTLYEFEYTKSTNETTLIR